MAKNKVTVEVCDNPRCEGGPGGRPYREEVIPSEEPAMGYHLGRGILIWGGGSPIPATYAHDEKCIVPAIQANLFRAEGKDPLTGEYE
jgi:hypothetical protein